MTSEAGGQWVNPPAAHPAIDHPPPGAWWSLLDHGVFCLCTCLPVARANCPGRSTQGFAPVFLRLKALQQSFQWLKASHPSFRGTSLRTFRFVAQGFAPVFSVARALLHASCHVCDATQEAWPVDRARTGRTGSDRWSGRFDPVGRLTCNRSAIGPRPGPPGPGPADRLRQAPSASDRLSWLLDPHP